jgi:opine dehydrogenase
MRIAVLGGGNGSFAAAGDLALAGHEVRLWRRDRAAVDAQRAAGGAIIVKDFRGRHEARPALITADIAEAMRGAALILCPTPATAQADIAKVLAPHLAGPQVVFLPPGTFGSMVFARAARDAGNRAEAAFAETGTLPWLTRKHGPFEAAITIRAKRLPTGGRGDTQRCLLKQQAMARVAQFVGARAAAAGDAGLQVCCRRAPCP